MSEPMEMDIDKIHGPGAGALGTEMITESNGKLLIYLMKKGIQPFWLRNLDLKTMTVNELIKEIKENQNFPTEFLGSTVQLNFLHDGTVISEKGNLGSTLESLNIKSEAPIAVIKILPNPNDTIPKKKYTREEIIRISMDIRTCFLVPTFIKTIQKLREADTLEKIFTIAPGLRSDPIGISIIQSPQMLFNLSEVAPLTELVDTRPWVVDALKHIAATLHAEKGTSPHSRQFSLAQLMHPGLGDNDDMDEDDSESDSAAGPSGSSASRTASQPNFRGQNQITRDQLSRALNSLSPGGTATSMLQNPLSTLMGLSPPARPTTAPPSSQSNSALSSNSGTPPISGDMVARMLSSALSQLPADQREQQLDALRHLAQQISGDTAPIISPPTLSANSETREYQEQLVQMRELGITDENLSILALRVSGGDVETAAELIFSGWDGSGAEPDS